MTDAPERIWVTAHTHQWGDWRDHENADHSPRTPYISEARHQAELAAVLEEAAARADQKAAWFRNLRDGHKLETVFDREFRHGNFCKAKGAESAAEAIRVLTPDDARAALDKLIAEAVKAEREACQEIADLALTGDAHGRDIAEMIRNRGARNEI